MTRPFDDFPPPSVDEDQLLAYLTGQMTADESHAFERQIALSEEGNPTLRDAKIVWKSSAPTAVAGNSHLFLTELRSRIARNTPTAGTPVRVPYSNAGGRSKHARRFWYTAAGCALGAALLITGWFGGGIGSPRPGNQQPSVYTTSNGERAKVMLPDGTVIELNVATRLEVPSDYAVGNRTVVLDGEALFTVTHHRSTPFTVVSGPSTTRVLGTSFVVRHYQTDTAATVAVRDGKVAVGNLVLTAAEQVTVAGATFSGVEPASPGRFTFAKGVLTIDDLALSSAIPELNRWYNVEIRLGDASLATRNLYGRFAAGSVAECAEFLELALNVRVVREGRILTLYPRR